MIKQYDISNRYKSLVLVTSARNLNDATNKAHEYLNNYVKEEPIILDYMLGGLFSGALLDRHDLYRKIANRYISEYKNQKSSIVDHSTGQVYYVALDYSNKDINHSHIEVMLDNLWTKLVGGYDHFTGKPHILGYSKYVSRVAPHNKVRWSKLHKSSNIKENIIFLEACYEQIYSRQLNINSIDSLLTDIQAEQLVYLTYEEICANKVEAYKKINDLMNRDELNQLTSVYDIEHESHYDILETSDWKYKDVYALNFTLELSPAAITLYDESEYFFFSRKPIEL